VSSVASQRQPLMFRARSYMAFVFTPQPPIVDWLAELDASLTRSDGFFADHAVALDLSAVQLSPSAIAHLIANLAERKIRVLGIEGLKDTDGQSELPPGLPPILRNGRGAQNFELPKAGTTAAQADAETAAAPAAVDAPSSPLPLKPQATSLLIQDPVRSGQSVVFIEGDITILGSVASGAEIVAGGSIHVYGALRGRAIAGAGGNSSARIFCHRAEAELLAIDCYYKTADDIEASLRRRPVQAWLEGGIVKISAMN
jgi:septum site-determining protein MinC